MGVNSCPRVGCGRSLSTWRGGPNGYMTRYCTDPDCTYSEQIHGTQIVRDALAKEGNPQHDVYRGPLFNNPRFR